MIKNANNILFRCSALGSIMTEPQGKSNLQKYLDKRQQHQDAITKYEAIKNKQTKTASNLAVKILDYEIQAKELDKIKNEISLSKTCTSNLAKVYIKHKFNREKNIENRYITKGLEVEEESLTLYSRYTKQYYLKNESTFQNEFIKGTPDIIVNPSSEAETDHLQTIIDIKSSWDIFTFFDTTINDLNSNYYWQLQGYMALTGASKARLVYCLVNTPDAIINDEKRRLMWKMNVLSDTDPNYIEACNKLDLLFIYNDIDINEKINIIEFDRNDEDIEKIYQRVEQCRKYINQTFFKL